MCFANFHLSQYYEAFFYLWFFLLFCSDFILCFWTSIFFFTAPPTIIYCLEFASLLRTRDMNTFQNSLLIKIFLFRLFKYLRLE